MKEAASTPRMFSSIRESEGDYPDLSARSDDVHLPADRPFGGVGYA